MRVLNIVETITQAYKFFKWAEKTGFKHNKIVYFTMVEILDCKQKLYATRTLVFDMPKKMYHGMMTSSKA